MWAIDDLHQSIPHINETATTWTILKDEKASCRRSLNPRSSNTLNWSAHVFDHFITSITASIEKQKSWLREALEIPTCCDIQPSSNYDYVIENRWNL